MKVIFFNAQTSGTTWGDGSASPTANHNDSDIRLNMSRGFSIDANGFLLDELGNQITYINSSSESGLVKLVRNKSEHLSDNHHIDPNTILSNLEIGAGSVREIVNGRYDISYDTTYFPFTIFMTLDESIITDTNNYFVIELEGLHKPYQLNSYQGIRYNPGVLTPNLGNNGADHHILNFLFLDRTTGDISRRTEANLSNVIGLGISINTNRNGSSSRSVHAHLGKLRVSGTDINSKINLNLYDSNFNSSLLSVIEDSARFSPGLANTQYPNPQDSRWLEVVRGQQGHAIKVGTSEGANDIFEQRIGIAGIVDIPSNIICVPCFSCIYTGGGLIGFNNGSGVFDLKFHAQ